VQNTSFAWSFEHFKDPPFVYTRFESKIKGKFRQEVTVVRASCDECGVDGNESHKLDFGKTEKLVRMGCVTVEKFRKRWNIEDGCFSYDPVSLRVWVLHQL